MAKKIQKSEAEWKETLTPEQYRVMRRCGTEPAWSGKYNDFYEKGTFLCAACGNPLFSSTSKYDHGTGWPSFMAPSGQDSVEFRDDYSFGMHRIEVKCAACGAHLGHVFDDGPAPTNKHYCINSAVLNFQPAEESGKAPVAAGEGETALPKQEEAVFASGCFWGVEDKFSRLPGVLSTVVGYTGGRTENPTYAAVCTNTTGHAEAVRVTFDPSLISYEELVRKFFSFHDPTQLNRQGPDIGTQYRSVVFYLSQEQKISAARVKDELERKRAFKKKIVTDIVPAGKFYEAEEYHQKYYEKNKIRSCGL